MDESLVNVNLSVSVVQGDAAAVLERMSATLKEVVSGYGLGTATLSVTPFDNMDEETEVSSE